MTELLTLKDVQKLLGVSRNTVLRMRRNGHLAFVTLNARCVRVPRSEITSIISEAKKAQGVPPKKPAKPKPRLMPKAQRLAMAAAAAAAAH